MKEWKNDMSSLHAFLPFSIIIFLLYGALLVIGRKGVVDPEESSFLNDGGPEQVADNRFQFMGRFFSFIFNMGTFAVLIVNFVIIFITLMIIDPKRPGEWFLPTIGNYFVIALFVYIFMFFVVFFTNIFEGPLGLPIMHNLFDSNINAFRESMELKESSASAGNDFDYSFILNNFSLTNMNDVMEFISASADKNIISSIGIKPISMGDENMDEKADPETVMEESKKSFSQRFLTVLVEKFYFGNGIFFILANIFIIYCVLLLNTRFIFSFKKTEIETGIEIDRSAVKDADQNIADIKKKINEKKEMSNIDYNVGDIGKIGNVSDINIDVKGGISKDMIPSTDNPGTDRLPKMKF